MGCRVNSVLQEPCKQELSTGCRYMGVKKTEELISLAVLIIPDDHGRSQNRDGFLCSDKATTQDDERASCNQIIYVKINE